MIKKRQFNNFMDLTINIDGLKNKFWELKKQGKKQYEVADECQISRNRFCYILNGKKNITITELVRCCEVFDCAIEDLIKVERKNK